MRPGEIAETITRALNATQQYQPPGCDLRPVRVETWGPADTADLTVAEPDGSTWTVRIFKGLNDTEARPGWHLAADHPIADCRLAGCGWPGPGEASPAPQTTT